MMDRPVSTDRRPTTVGVHMKCCNVYIRVNVNYNRDVYVGWCPRCASQVRIPIVQEGGSSDRIFSAS